jgi:hypothetical protein
MGGPQSRHSLRDTEEEIAVSGKVFILNLQGTEYRNCYSYFREILIFKIIFISNILNNVFLIYWWSAYIFFCQTLSPCVTMTWYLIKHRSNLVLFQQFVVAATSLNSRQHGLKTILVTFLCFRRLTYLSRSDDRYHFTNETSHGYIAYCGWVRDNRLLISISVFHTRFK